LDEGGTEVLPAVDRAGRKGFEPVLCLTAHHHREVGRHDVIVAVRGSNGDGIVAQPRLGVGFAVKLLDVDRLEGRGPLDGSQPVGESGESVEVIRQVVVVVAGSTIAVVAVGARCAMLLVVAATSFPLSIVPFAMTVVDVGLKIAAAEAIMEIWLVDLLVAVMGAYRVVGARLRPIVGVLPP
jgi:hypothetical protein